MKAEVFYKENCYFSKEALRILEQNGIEVEKEEVSTSNPIEFTDFINNATNSDYSRATVPQIWLDGKYIGGCDDLYRLMR